MMLRCRSARDESFLNPFAAEALEVRSLWGITFQGAFARVASAKRSRFRVTGIRVTLCRVTNAVYTA